MKAIRKYRYANKQNPKPKILPYTLPSIFPVHRSLVHTLYTDTFDTMNMNIVEIVSKIYYQFKII